MSTGLLVDTDIIASILAVNRAEVFVPSIYTIGAFVYPVPAFVMLIAEIFPLYTSHVAVAVTPLYGADIRITGADEYPLPPLTIVMDVIDCADVIGPELVASEVPFTLNRNLYGLS